MNATVGKGRALQAGEDALPASGERAPIRYFGDGGRSPAQKPAGFADRTTSAFRNRLVSIAASAEFSSARRGTSRAFTGVPGNAEPERTHAVLGRDANVCGLE